MFAPDLSDQERQEMVISAYKKLKASFEEFSKPDGGKTSPAKTCHDLSVAHPDKTSGQWELIIIIMIGAIPSFSLFHIF